MILVRLSVFFLLDLDIEIKNAVKIQIFLLRPSNFMFQRIRIKGSNPFNMLSSMIHDQRSVRASIKKKLDTFQYESLKTKKNNKPSKIFMKSITSIITNFSLIRQYIFNK